MTPNAGQHKPGTLPYRVRIQPNNAPVQHTKRAHAFRLSTPSTIAFFGGSGTSPMPWSKINDENPASFCEALYRHQLAESQRQLLHADGAHQTDT